MSFDDLDFGEEFIGKPCVEFDAQDLKKYAYEMFREQFGYKLIMNWGRDDNMIKKFLSDYGTEAPRLVKWMFYKHNGTFRGEVFNFMWFNSGHQWWVNQRLHEMKKELGEVKKVKRPSKFGFMSVRTMSENGSATA